MIIDQLIHKIIQCKNHTVVGLDPRLDYIPSYIKEEAFGSTAEYSEGAAKSFLSYNKILIDHLYDIVPAVKPQIAFYEQYGYHGIKCFYDTCLYAKEKGLLVIGDVKRGDIGSTAEGYSEAYLGKEEYSAKTDFITINPYLGSDSLLPFIANCKNNEKGIFVLVKTSNKSSADLQDLVCNGNKIYEKTAEMVMELSKDFIGSNQYSFIGAVVGATFKEQAEVLRKKMKHNYFLVPGYGAQGGTASDAAVCFNADGLGAVVNSSRGIIAAYLAEEYKNRFEEKDFALSAREAAISMREAINKELEKQKKLAW